MGGVECLPREGGQATRRHRQTSGRSGPLLSTQILHSPHFLALSSRPLAAINDSFDAFELLGLDRQLESQVMLG
jgi:hypothetical protein